MNKNTSRTIARFTVFGFLCAIGFSTNLWADGNMTVEVRNGNLKITGQNKTDQTVTLTRTGPSSFSLYSSDGTLFNGQQTLTVNNVTRDIQFDLKSGKKDLKIVPIPQLELEIQGNLKIKSSGNGDTLIFLYKLIVRGQTEISTKNGNDYVNFEGCEFRGRVRVNTGDGNDFLHPFLSDFQNQFESSLGKGDDYLIIDHCNILSFLKAETGQGNDVIWIESSLVVGARLDGGRGVDVVRIRDNTFIMEPVLKSIEVLEQ